MALDASAGDEHKFARGVLAQLLKKPSQEQIVLLLVLALISIVFSFSLPGFSTVKNLLNLVRSISILGILGTWEWD